MKKLIALVLALMLCLSGFACAENPARKTALQVIDEINMFLSMLQADEQFTIIAQDDDTCMYVATPDGSAVCFLEYSGNGTALRGFMIVTYGVETAITMGTIMAPLVDPYYGPDDERAYWAGTAMAEILKDLNNGEETSLRSRPLGTDGELSIYGKNVDNQITVVFAVSGGDRIDVR